MKFVSLLKEFNISYYIIFTYLLDFYIYCTLSVPIFKVFLNIYILSNVGIFNFFSTYMNIISRQ